MGAACRNRTDDLLITSEIALPTELRRRAARVRRTPGQRPEVYGGRPGAAGIGDRRSAGGVVRRDDAGDEVGLDGVVDAGVAGVVAGVAVAVAAEQDPGVELVGQRDVLFLKYVEGTYAQSETT